MKTYREHRKEEMKKQREKGIKLISKREKVKRNLLTKRVPMTELEMEQELLIINKSKTIHYILKIPYEINFFIGYFVFK